LLHLARAKSVIDPIADIAAILAVVAGAVAAVFAWRGDRFSRQTHSRDVEPRVRMSQFDGHDYWLGNAGGAAPVVLVLVLEHDGTVQVIGYTGLPAMTAGVKANWTSTLGQIAPSGTTPRAILIAAKDVELRWWDCIAGALIQDFSTWWAGQLHHLALPAWTVVEYSGGLGYKLSPP
jgi:hypothetical protein